MTDTATAETTQGTTSLRPLSHYLMRYYDPELGYVDMSRNDAEIFGIDATTFTHSVRSLIDEGSWRVEFRPHHPYRFYPLLLDETSSV